MLPLNITTVLYHRTFLVYHIKTQISVPNSEKLLGVTIDNTLSWSTQVDSVINKCNTYLYLLSRVKSFLSVENRRLFYNAYILPYFDYCCIIWGNCNTALKDRFVRFRKKTDALLLNTLNWMTFPESVVYQKALQMYKTTL